ncbi:hypothetical protein R1flu_011540 [Riccia fluitans]|uniref:MBD domain-containing protein n=1 Tax=Riccia fluitans TaxID=41844 RepID=A0ABD1Z971_9MARC
MAEAIPFSSWKEFATNPSVKVQDMYFTAPDGSQFRSRRALNDYLKTLTNPPAPTDFCWSITPEVLDHPALQAFKSTPGPKKASPSKKRKAKAPEKTGGEPKGRKSRK